VRTIVSTKFVLMPALTCFLSPGRGQGTHREGFVVRFHTRTTESWVGNFQGGFGSFDGVFLHPDNRTVIVVSRGQAYHLNPWSRALLRHFGGCITTAIQDTSQNLLVFADWTGLWAFDAKGQRWVSERVSIDGIRNLKVGPDSVVGEAFDPSGEKWYPFSVSLQTGKLRNRIRNFFRW
jgi:hypothetical protein